MAHIAVGIRDGLVMLEVYLDDEVRAVPLTPEETMRVIYALRMKAEECMRLIDRHVANADLPMLTLPGVTREKR